MFSFFMGALTYAALQNGYVLKTLEQIVPRGPYNTILLLVSVSSLMIRITKLKLLECLRSCKRTEVEPEVEQDVLEAEVQPEKPTLRMRKPRVVKDFLEENGNLNKNF